MIQRLVPTRLDGYVTRFLRGVGGASAEDVSRTNFDSQSWSLNLDVEILNAGLAPGYGEPLATRPATRVPGSVTLMKRMLSQTNAKFLPSK